MEIVIGAGSGEGNKGCSSCICCVLPAIAGLIAFVFLLVSYESYSKAQATEREAEQLSEPLTPLEHLKPGDTVRFQAVLSQPDNLKTTYKGRPCVAFRTKVSLESFSMRTEEVIRERPVTKERRDAQGRVERYRSTETYLAQVETKLPFSQVFYNELRGPDELILTTSPVELRLPLGMWAPDKYSESLLKEVPDFASSAELPRPSGKETSGFKVKEAWLTSNTAYFVTARVSSREGNVATLKQAKFQLGSQQDLAAVQREIAAKHHAEAKDAFQIGMSLLGIGTGLWLFLTWLSRRR